MNLDLTYSGPVKTAAQLSAKAIDHHRFLAKKVLLTGEPDILNTANGRECLLSAFALLIRICPNIRIHIPAGCDDLGAVSQALVKRIAFGPGVEHCDHVDDLRQFDGTLNEAQVGDLFVSLIHTCELCHANSFDNLTELQRHARELAADPAAWMPWNYRDTIGQAV
jgi:hypothetical protein